MHTLLALLPVLGFVSVLLWLAHDRRKDKQRRQRSTVATMAWAAIGAWAWSKLGKPLLERIPLVWRIVGGLLLAGVLALIFKTELAAPVFVATMGLVAYAIVQRRRKRVSGPERIVQDWTSTVAENSTLAALKGSTATVVGHDRNGFAIRCSLVGGRTSGDVQKLTDNLESVFRTRPGALRVIADRDAAHQVLLRFTTQDPLEAVVDWPGPDAGHLRDPVGLGVDEHGALVRVQLLDRLVLVAGQRGRGKSTVLGVLTAALIAMHDVEVWGVDPKGSDLIQFEGRMPRLAVEPQDVLELLQAAEEEMEARKAVMRSKRVANYPISEERPALVIVVDELAEVTDEAKAMVEHVARLGRARRVQLVLATQRPDVASLGDAGGALRSHVTTTIGLGVRTPEESRLVFGSAAAAAGWDASRLRIKGTFLLRDDEHDEPTVARCFWPGRHIAGAGKLAVLPDPDVIEGDYREVR